jgi:teichuronic acid biosynthesis glycosyltransferase TuaG
MEVKKINKNIEHILVSVVIPVYNASKYIEETLDCLLFQTHKNFEVIIVDDCSTDNTICICRTYEKKFKEFTIIKTDKNFGCPGGPRNLGVKHSAGEWIAFLDADDLWHREKLSIQLQAAKSSNINFVSSKMQRFKSSCEYNSDIKFSKIPTKKIKYLGQMLNYQTPTSSVLVKRSILKNLLFQEGIKYGAREDIDLWLRIHKLIKTSLKVDLELVGYRVLDGQISGNKLKMFRKTYFCYSNSSGVTPIFGPLTPFILTIAHFLRRVYLPNFKRGF